jgi:hypothetical protein
MWLLCGDKVVDPIHPGKIAHLVNSNNMFISVNDATYEGFYSYPADAISTSCGKVTLEVYSEKNPAKPDIKVLDPKTVTLIEKDFAPYLKDKSTTQ